MVKHIEAIGLEAGLPLPWSVAAAFGKVFGATSGKADDVGEAAESRKTGKISLYAYATYVDFKVLGTICEPHWKSSLSIQEESDLAAYQESLKCFGEKSIDGLIQPLMSSYGLSKSRTRQLTDSVTTAYDAKLSRARQHYRGLGSENTKSICVDLVRNNHYSDYVLAEKLDAMKYQFGRGVSGTAIFDGFMNYSNSCPRRYSLFDNISIPAFLQE